MPRLGRLTTTEKKYIIEKYLVLPLAEISRQLNRDDRTIRKFVKDNGVAELAKQTKGKDKTLIISASPDSAYDEQLQAVSTADLHKLSEQEKKEFFISRLRNSLHYENIKKQFTLDEIEYYIQEWGSLCVQFDDIVSTEIRQIDEFIKAEILGNRILRNIKIAEDEYNTLAGEIEQFRAKAKDKLLTDDELMEKDQALMNMIKAIGIQSQVMSDHYQKNVEARNKLLSELNARRRDRVEQIKNRGITFIGLVEELRKKEIRDQQGRYIELAKMAREKKLSDWRKPIRFADGVREPVLMDEKSYDYNPADDAVRFIRELTKTTGNTILIVEDNFFRKQFFSSLFLGHKLHFASNADKAIDLLDQHAFTHIFLDYDLGLNQKGSKVVHHIIDNKLFIDAAYFIHSNNKEGAENMHATLRDRREVLMLHFDAIYAEFKPTFDMNTRKIEEILNERTKENGEQS